ncbi:translation initiation factor IF-2-like [Cygnus olor]|uniref:translation initiation factor IF-2-like n=1 Tax=Cygnus olor TaxID=8869 RepID=UPI001ADE570C|nr:translation initiation factor IF-2-like [Cygnus olor]
MGIDTTGPWGHGCSPAPALSGPTKPPQPHVGLRGCPKGDPQEGLHPPEETGPWGHHGAQSQHDPVPPRKEPCSRQATATLEHPVPPVPREKWPPWTARTAPQLPAQPWCHPLGTRRTRGTSQGWCVTWGHALVPGADAAGHGADTVPGAGHSAVLPRPLQVPTRAAARSLPPARICDALPGLGSILPPPFPPSSPSFSFPPLSLMAGREKAAMHRKGPDPEPSEGSPGAGALQRAGVDLVKSMHFGDFCARIRAGTQRRDPCSPQDAARQGPIPTPCRAQIPSNSSCTPTHTRQAPPRVCQTRDEFLHWFPSPVPGWPCPGVPPRCWSRRRDGKLLEHQLRLQSPGNSCYAKHSEVEFTVTVNNR